MCIEKNKILLSVGLITILISLGTWLIDLSGMVEPCVYCRTERTIIGILGIMMILPFKGCVMKYIATIFGLLGAHVANAQIFGHIVAMQQMEMLILNIMLPLATAALFIIVAQVFLIFYRK